MLDICISERLQESNLDRARQDGLDVARATHAVERTGAALVFGRKETITVPDSEIDLAAEASSLDIADVLPDWSPHDRDALLARAVFDPATLGRARVHNDNQGVVRGYLAARWLNRLRKRNLSQTGLFDLLFAESYGIEVIKPSMQETAAWLSLWNENVAREVSRRNPFLLLTAGDPATLSRVRICATTMPSNSPASLLTPSTSKPSIVRRSASSSEDQSKSTYCLSQLKVTFMKSNAVEPVRFYKYRFDHFARNTQAKLLQLLR